MIAVLRSFAYHDLVQSNSEFLELINAESYGGKTLNALFDGMSMPRATYRECDAIEARRIFREYLGAWVASGFQPDGSEVPERRQYTTWDIQAILETLERPLNCVLTIPEKNVFGFQAEQRELRSPAKGLLSVRLGPRGGIDFYPLLFSYPLSAKELAAYTFLAFWKSQWLFAVMRCAHCGVFDVPDHKRKSYVRGWHCVRCRNIASALVVTKQARKNRSDAWFRRAVDAYLDYHGSRRRTTADPILFITERVNKGLRLGWKIKRNSITRNLAKIKMAAEDKKNAKG